MLVEEAPAREVIGVNKRKRAAVLQAIDSVGCENLSMMQQKEREDKIIRAVERDCGLRVTDRYVRRLFSELRNVPK